MTFTLYQRLAPDLTVANPTGRVELQFASAAVLAAVQGIGLDDAQLTVDERNQPLFPDGDSPPPLNRGGPLYRLRIDMVRGEPVHRTTEVLFQLQRGLTPPVQVFWRRYGLLDRQG
jgi:general secretion pathway protein K